MLRGMYGEGVSWQVDEESMVNCQLSLEDSLSCRRAGWLGTERMLFGRRLPETIVGSERAGLSSTSPGHAGTDATSTIQHLLDVSRLAMDSLWAFYGRRLLQCAAI